MNIIHSIVYLLLPHFFAVFLAKHVGKHSSRTFYVA